MPQRVRLPQPEAEAKAETMLKLADDLVSVYVMDHPFTKRLKAADLPLEAVQSACLDWYGLHRKLAASFARLYHRFIQICRSHTDIEEEILERISHELTRPKAGGRTLLLRDTVKALGVPEKTLNNPPQGSDLRGYVAFFGRLHSEGTFAEVVAGQLGTAFAPYARLWHRALKEHYGVADPANQYWELNSRLDQEKVGGGVLGTRAENAYLLRRVFEEGLTESRYNWSMEYSAEMTVKLWAYLLRSYVRRFKL
jgi:pyrroloquinoline quinone (PQQ) biosynthesis protein C